ncbi:GNAT family N-acetyltransferase [Sulfitobacter sp. S190]|uniref:GNAT family N-acetyltransferase n=1 Tax=Sulfitobacter sp. S190 TaxID=2867022 RepID=UPI0021A797BC|nr:GNAT family N-acetyltransferase [Sulfitobacter sp. S190]UWR22743.1 GNAT family N-acetyltransferase [Sulfitobacter sp. S190]
MGQVMYDAIHAEPSPYTEAERRAWLAKPPAAAEWHARLARQSVWYASDAEGPAGFMTLEGSYLDFAYVVARGRGTGVFRALYRCVEDHARRGGQPAIRTHASLMAQPAFAAVGFAVLRHEAVPRAGQFLRRAEMEKKLEPAP